jgi:hypothetical protein
MKFQHFYYWKSKCLFRPSIQTRELIGIGRAVSWEEISPASRVNGRVRDRKQNIVQTENRFQKLVSAKKLSPPAYKDNMRAEISYQPSTCFLLKCMFSEMCHETFGKIFLFNNNPRVCGVRKYLHGKALA